jgi:hypothetical protein
MGRPVVVVDLFGYGGGRLEARKQGQQEQYEDCPSHLPPSDIGTHH